MAVDQAPFVSVTQGMRGYFAVLLTFDEECGFHTPWNSGHGSYGSVDEAEFEAKAWAEAEEIEYCRPMHL